MSRRKEWTCPRCHQRFVAQSARHSCSRQTVASFFKGRPALHTVFKTLRAELCSLGAVQVAATRSQVSFRARTRFAWVWLPQRWLRDAPEDALVLSLALDRRVRSRRIKEAVEVAPGRWMHHLVLDASSRLDSELRGWMRRAYELGAFGTPSTCRDGPRSRRG